MRIRIFVLLLLCAWAGPSVWAQAPAASKESKPEAKKDKSAKPEPKKGTEKKDAAPKKDPAEKKSDGGDAKAPGGDDEKEDPLAKVFGEGGMDLNADRITSIVNPETSELQTMHIEGSVKIVSELMNIECDDLKIDMEKQEMLATGKIVNFKKQDVAGTCGRLTYFMESKKTFLEGRPKPLIRQTDAKGRVTQTSADKITMVQNENTNNVNWEGHVEFKVIPSADEKKEEKDTSAGPKEAPKKLDASPTEKLRAPAIDGGR